MPAIYDRVQGNHPGTNRFDLSHSHFMTMKVGKLYIAMCKEMYPGDVFKVSDAVHCELQPMVAPLLSDLNMYCHTFFVPYRLIYGVDHDDGKSIWEKYITGGEDGDYDTPLPAWQPTWSKVGFSSDTIWDSVGNPVTLTTNGTGTALDPYVYTWTPNVPSGLAVSKAPQLAYNFVYNTYYLDENLQTEVSENNEDLLYANWRKDYFTSALESQQFGTAPALPVTLAGSLPVSFIDSSQSTPGAAIYGGKLLANGNGNLEWQSYKSDGTFDTSGTGTVKGSVDSSGITATTFDVADMRLVFAMQRLMELSQVGGHRYVEYLRCHFGVSPSDQRLDRPEYIGGCVFPVNVSVSVQSSETSTTPQGNKAGIGNINNVEYIGSYRAEEYGLIMTLVSIRPKPCYQQGISREWLRQTRWDYYSPEFANLSEMAVYRAEVYVDPTDAVNPDNGIFGYQAHWNELRASNNFVSGAMREQFDYWLMSRKFASRPALNDDFISLGHPSEYNRIWAVQDEDQFIVAFSNIVDAYRPLPAFGTPGLIDHVYGGR